MATDFEKLDEKYAQLTAERDRLAEALRKIATMRDESGQPRLPIARDGEGTRPHRRRCVGQGTGGQQWRRSVRTSRDWRTGHLATFSRMVRRGSTCLVPALLSDIEVWIVRADLAGTAAEEGQR